MNEFILGGFIGIIIVTFIRIVFEIVFNELRRIRKEKLKSPRGRDAI